MWLMVLFLFRKELDYKCIPPFFQLVYQPVKKPNNRAFDAAQSQVYPVNPLCPFLFSLESRRKALKPASITWGFNRTQESKAALWT